MCINLERKGMYHIYFIYNTVLHYIVLHTFPVGRHGLFWLHIMEAWLKVVLAQ